MALLQTNTDLGEHAAAGVSPVRAFGMTRLRA